MKKNLKFILSIIIILSLIAPSIGYARGGDSGYEGGISSGEAPGKVSYDYQEVNFITGEPIVYKGSLVIKKSLKKDNVVTTYTYNLRNIDRNATLTRTLTMSTKLTQKANGQIVEDSILDGRTSEVIRVNNVIYTLRNYDFTRTNLVDCRPAINYYAGNLWGKKTYQVGGGTGAASGGTISLEETGEFYGYDQYWGTTEVMTVNYIIESEQKRGNETDRWMGTADIKLSANTTKKLKYIENQPDQISFEGGYIQTQYNESILEYSSALPEFDQKGIATDVLNKVKGSLKLESFPVQNRLPVADLGHLRGHWAENDIKTLFSLEILKDGSKNFNPEEYITRAEFASIIVEAAREVPEDPALAKKTTRTQRSAGGRDTQKIVSPFNDVSTDHKYFQQIDSAFKRGLMDGNGDNTFHPDRSLTVADALTVFIRALGLESLAPNPAPVTMFKDNDEIPSYARKSAYVAQKIGLIKGDTKGYLRPNEKLTKGRAAALVNRFINYLREDIKKDYRERIVNY